MLLAETGKRIAENRTLAAEVLQTIPVDQPDLFAAMPGRQSHAARPGARFTGSGEADGHG